MIILKNAFGNFMAGLNGTRWDAPITLTLGDAIDGQSANLSKHCRAESVLIAYTTFVNNSHGIEIGYDNNDNYNKDLEDITIAHHLISASQNSLVEIIEADNDKGDKINWINNPMEYPKEPKDGIELGEEFEYEVNVYEGIMHLTFKCKGHLSKTFTKNLVSSEYSNRSDIPKQTRMLQSNQWERSRKKYCLVFWG